MENDMTIKTGDSVPMVDVGIMTGDGPGVTTTETLFRGKTVALFGLPGAFTKTCSGQHLPGYVQNADAFREKGVDAIICLSVNDPWVMDAWGKSQNVGDKVLMIGDGALNFTRAAGLEVDLSDKCYGPRCKRFSALVVDGVVKTLHFETGGFGETSAEKLLEDLS
jgi:glutaredoxin/glutathione-dependent peroxiredoxin